MSGLHLVRIMPWGKLIISRQTKNYKLIVLSLSQIPLFIDEKIGKMQ